MSRATIGPITYSTTQKLLPCENNWGAGSQMISYEDGAPSAGSSMMLPSAMLFSGTQFPMDRTQKAEKYAMEV